MLRRILLPTLLAIALFATVGVASAAVVRSTDGPAISAATVDTTSTTVDDSFDGGDSTTSTTMPSTTSTTVDDSFDGGDSTTSTTMPSTTSTTIDDDFDDDSDDDVDDDDSTTSTTIEGAVSVPDGIHVINAAPAGSVTVAVNDGVLSLVSVDIAGSWSKTETEMSAREIELEFESEGTELKVEAEIEDGRVKLRAEFKTDGDSAHDDSADDDSGHGSDDG